MTFRDLPRLAAPALFLTGILLVAMTKGDMATVAFEAAAGKYIPDGTCLECQRNTAWLFYLLRGVLNSVSALFFLGPESGPLGLETPWAFADSGRNRDVAVAILALYGHRLILALPLYLLAVRLFQGLWSRLIYIAVLLSVLGGWPAVMVNGLLRAGQLVAHWPVAYYNFAHPLFNFDWAGIGFVNLLALAILAGTDRKPLLVLLLAAFGQVLMDNLGLVTGLSLGLAGWASSGLRRGALALSAAGLGTMLVVGLQSSLGMMSMEQAGLAQAAITGGGPLAKLGAWWGYYWETMGKYNFLWWNVTIANFISLMAWPLVVGALLGLVLPAETGRSRDDVPMTRALGLPALAFFATLLIALFKSGVSSDMGRQVMPLLTLIIPLTITLVARWRRG